MPACRGRPGNDDQNRGDRTNGSRPFREVAAAEPRGEQPRELAHSSSDSISVSDAGSETTYFSEAQFPKSINLQRSLQNGMKGSASFTGLWQIGHCILKSY